MSSDGALLNQSHRTEPASHAVGTTVRVSQLFQSLPVREQMNLKDTPKHLSRLKRLLQSYALARPNVRLSLKVLRARSERGNFTYAPKPGASNTSEDAMLKVFGKDIVRQCAWSALKADGFELQVFLPRSDANPASTANGGQFVSIDSRPMQANRGTLKQIVQLCKEALRKSSAAFEGVRDSFLYLDFTCPSGVYDANVEPAKDNVLFGDEEHVIGIVKRLLETFYQTTEQPVVDFDATTAKTGDGCAAGPKETDDIEQEQTEVPQHQDTDDTRMIDDEEVTFIERQPVPKDWRGNMYGFDDEDADLSFDVDERTLIEDQPDITGTAKDVKLSNPWTVAKMADSRHRPFNKSTPTSALAINLSTPAKRNNEQDDGSALSDVADGAIIRRSGFIQDQIEAWDGNSVHDLNTSLQLPPVIVLPTPPPSSSPVFGIPLDAIPQVPSRKKAQKIRNRDNINRSHESPVNSTSRKDLNWFDFSQFETSQRSRRSRPLGKNQSRDIREFMAPKARANATPLAVQGGEPSFAAVQLSSTYLPCQRSLAQAQSQSGEPANETEISDRIIQQRFVSETEALVSKKHLKRAVSRIKSFLQSTQKEYLVHSLRLTLQVTTADINQYIEKGIESETHAGWVALSASLTTSFSRLLEVNELEGLCRRMTECLQSSLSADEDFNVVCMQMREAFAQLASQ